MKTYYPYIIAVIFAVLFFHQCGRTNDAVNRAESVREFLNDTIRHYKNETGQLVAEKRTLQGGKNELQVLLSKQIDSTGQLRRLIRKQRNTTAAGNITQKTVIDSVRIEYVDTIPFVFSRPFSLEDPYYSISGLSDQNGITINSLEIPNILSFAVEGNTIRAVNSNPYIKTTGLDSYALDISPKRWHVVLVGGYGVTNNGLSPYIGLGAGYSLFSF